MNAVYNVPTLDGDAVVNAEEGAEEQFDQDWGRQTDARNRSLVLLALMVVTCKEK